MSELTSRVQSERLFFQTPAAQIACQSLDRICEEQIVGMIVGMPGVGKTHAIDFWRRRQGASFRHILIRADVLCSTRPIINALTLGLNVAVRKSLSEMKFVVVEELAQHPCMVIIDEADLLTVRPFDLIRSIWDGVAELRGYPGERGFPLALFGTPHLRDMLARDDLERLRRRTFHKAELPALSSEGVRKVLQKWPGLTFDEEGLAELTRLSRGSFGWLNVIIPIAQKLAAKNGKVLTAHILRATSKHLIGLPEED